MTDTEQARPASSGTTLSGMKEICEYVEKSSNTVRKYIRDELFPASKICGGWVSDKDLIDLWRIMRIQGERQLSISKKLG